MTALIQYVNGKKKPLMGAIPQTLRAQMTWESIIQGVGLAMSDNPYLAKCDPATVYHSLLEILRQGLDLNTCHLVPFGRECTPIIGYQGKIELAYRSGRIRKINTQVIHQNDTYTIDLASGEIRHTLDLTLDDRGPALAAYCLIWLADQDDPLMELMTLRDFEKIKADANRRNKGKLSPAYTNWPTEMWRRSVLNRALKRAPKSVDILNILEPERTRDVIDAEPIMIEEQPEQYDFSQDERETVEATPAEPEPEQAPVDDGMFGGMP